MSGPAIEARGLGKDYGPIRAVEALDLTVEPGAFFALLGPNGAGKTTTVHLLATLLAPSRGEARVGGRDVRREPLEVRRRIGLVFQDSTLDRDLTAAENLHFAAALYGIDRTTARRRVAEMLKLFGLEERRDDRVGTFSGGMKRALDIARGLLHRPPILFLDEPTLGLDPVNRRGIWEMIRRLRAEHRITIFLTTHYLDEAEACDEVAIIDRGRIIAGGSPPELKAGLGREVIELEAPHRDALEERIRVRLGSPPRRTPRGYEIRLSDAEAALRGALALLEEGVRSVQVRRPSLEDVFLELTGRVLDGAAGEGAAVGMEGGGRAKRQ
ncbi:MAG: ATP-binding cassette domain-containing protein [Gemmatimonadota bacterium]